MNRLSFFIPFLVLLVLGCKKKKCEDREFFEVRITNNTSDQNLAVKLPNLCWQALYPTDFRDFTITANTNSTIIAFSEADDSLAFSRVLSVWNFENCFGNSDYVKPPDVQQFSFTANKCTEGIDEGVFAEDAGGTQNGIRGVIFKIGD